MIFSPLITKFLEAYSLDVSIRWSANDLKAQEKFINAEVENTEWLDWSSQEAALQLVQAEILKTSLGETGEFDRIVVAGPVVELLDLPILLNRAARYLKRGGRIAAVIPCLRDNSPENAEFTAIAAKRLWPYATSEELLESTREAGLDPLAESKFVPVRRFIEAALGDQLRFTPFRDLFLELQSQGYDPMEVGWGELRLLAQLSH
jgi:hypothetical protein